MPESLPRPDLELEIEGRFFQLRTSPLFVGVWDVFDSAAFLGTIAQGHSFKKDSNPKYLARRDGSLAPELVDGLTDGVRFLDGGE